jgi:arabinose-5-phosphate isomerase
MRSEIDKRLVKIKPDTTVKDTILFMSKRRTGCAVVVDNDERLLGIFTDGDLRRHLSDDLSNLNNKVEDFMTKNPASVFSDQMAVSVLKLIESKHVDDVIVIDRDNKVVGIVDSQDLPGLKLM